jgi:uncharacterized membrane protein
MNDYIEKLGGRKFLIALLSIISNSLLVWFSKIEPSVYSTVTIAVVGGYIVGNVVQKNTATSVTVSK